MEDMKLHSFIVCVEYEVTCYTEDEAEMFYQDGEPNVIEVIDNGEIE